MRSQPDASSYQQTFVDLFESRGGQAVHQKIPITAAELLDDRVLPLFDDHYIPLLRMFSDRGTEYCGAHDRHPYELYFAVNDIEHTRAH